MLDDLNGKNDPCQFGCLRGLSTTFCLLDMLYTWLSYLDTQNNYIRVCFLDFSKAFDRIGYNVLINKLIDLGVRRSLIPWIINFLTDRRQRVKICRSISNWLPVTAGVPQGTKLGPILFLVMVNNLKPSTPDTRMWKFVDDSTVSEHLTGNIASAIQSTLNHIESWCSDNWMILNPKKCKELRICFLKRSVELQPLEISGCELEIVQSHKALGLTIQNNLKWDEHIRSIIAKASKRFHILRILRRSCIPPLDLIKIYIALIRSILEYSCEVWNNSITQYQNEELERVQKRVMGIIFPGRTYDEALIIANCERLELRRKKICINTLRKIITQGPLKENLLQTRETVHHYNIRNSKDISLYKCRTQRFNQ